MVMNRTAYAMVVGAALLFCLGSAATAQEAGGIRGTVYDRDFDRPLPNVEVLLYETGEKRTTTEEGQYVFAQVPPGTYTVVFAKEGFTRQFTPDVVVSPGQMTDLNATLAGEFTEMEEFIVQDLELGGSSELGLLNLRMESPSLLDSVSSDLMSQAGASDAAAALPLVSGTTVQDGKYAVVRGLPDRYVVSQLNGVRLPTADADKRAVQLDQFPAAIVESIQVSKTFTPDQQGDASGGAVNVVTKDVPEETVFQFSGQVSYNSQATGNSDFLSYDGGGVSFWGIDDGDRDIQTGSIGSNWAGAAGVDEDSAPVDYKWSLSGGGKHLLDNGVTLGGFGSFFYERDSSFYDNGIDDKYWVEDPGDPLTPTYIQGTPQQGSFKTQLFDVTQGSQSVKWGGLGTVGLETENHRLSLLSMYTRAAQDKATLAEDTRGKAYYFPGYDPYDSMDPGNQNPDAAPYLRAQTLEYTERTTRTIQLSGRHTPWDPQWSIQEYFIFQRPELDWSASFNNASMYQPDKRQFGSYWQGPSYNPGFPPFVDPFTSPGVYLPFKPAEAFTLGNFQRIWKDISEDDEQYAANVKFPFQQWTGDEGYFKLGLFYDTVDRTYEQDSFSNFNDNTARYEGPWSEFWSDAFPSENHPITDGPPFVDVDYDGEQEITAWYYMTDMPLWSAFKVIGGVRHETTDLSIVNDPERDATWIPLETGVSTNLNPGDADVSFSQDDVLPSLGFEYDPFESIKLRASYSQTVARQTFKELSPIQQVEYLGGDVFIGNPELGMSSLDNYDLRIDYTPYVGGLISLSYFYKDITDPIEYVQNVAGNLIYTTPVNYPEGELSGFELEVRQELGHFWESLDGLSIGANATFIDSEVTLSDEEAAKFEAPNIQAPMRTRDMTGAPEYLYNIFLIHDLERTGTQLGLFYTVRGDTLVAGAGQSNGRYVPNVYETEYGTLNFSLSQKMTEKLQLKFQAKNLLNPEIQEVYRSDYTSGDTDKTSYTKGIDLSLSMLYEF